MNTWFTSLNADQAINNMFIQAVDCLNYGQWTDADRLFDTIILSEPRNAGAFLGKVLAKYELSKPEELAIAVDKPVELEIDFRKARDFCTEEQAGLLGDFLKEKRTLEEYNRALLLSGSTTSEELLQAVAKFEGIAGYKDSDARAAECRERANKIQWKEQREQEEYQKIEEAKEKAKELLENADKLAFVTKYQYDRVLWNELIGKYQGYSKEARKNNFSLLQKRRSDLQSIVDEINNMTKKYVELRQVVTRDQMDKYRYSLDKLQYAEGMYKKYMKFQNFTGALRKLTILLDIAIIGGLFYFHFTGVEILDLLNRFIW